MQTELKKDDGTGDAYAPELYTPDRIAEGVDRFAAVTDEHLRLYEEQGYLLVCQAFAPGEVASAKQGLRDLIAGKHPDFGGFMYEPRVPDRLDTLSPAQRIAAVRKLIDFVGADHRCGAMAEHAGMMRVVERLIDGQPKLIQDMALLKQPNGREKPWHQDKAYFDYPIDTPIVGVWIALDRATLENGCMHVMAASHRDGPVLHFWRRDWQICDTDILGRTCVAVPMQPGDCLFFNGLLQHGTPANTTDQQRDALQFHYAPAAAQKVQEQYRLSIFGSEGKDVSC